MKQLNDYLNENYEQETEEMLRNGFVIKIEPKKINVIQSDDEYLIFEIDMTNGDTIEYDSYKPINPNPSVQKNTATVMHVNGKKVKLTKSDIEQGWYGAFDAYKRVRKF